jgi:CelD/BcsL family acetyltransferase involved in cellulose biosynthesis
VIEMLDVPDGAAFDHVMGQARRDGCFTGSWPTRRMPIFTLAKEGQDPFLHCPAQGKTTRSRLKGKLKKLEALGPVELRVNTSADSAVLDHFFTMEGGGWKGRNGSAIEQRDILTEYYSRLANIAADKGWLRMHTLAVGGKPIAMHFGLLMNGCYYMPKVCYDEAFAKYSPGHVLFWKVIQELPRSVVERVEFLGPQGPWKAVWSRDVRHYANKYIFRRSLKGAALYMLTMHVARAWRAYKVRKYGDPQDVDARTDAPEESKS